jgi:hypothetical protein
MLAAKRRIAPGPEDARDRDSLFLMPVSERRLFVRLATLILAAALLAGCSHSATPRPDEASAQIVKKNCADPHWKEANLGLWYSICRKPLQW